MEKYTVFMDQKNQYSENEYTTQSNLQIQWIPCQATNGIFQRARTNNFTICMEIQKTSEEAQAAIQIAGRNKNNLRYADDTTLMTGSEEELKKPLDESERGE